MILRRARVCVLGVQQLDTRDERMSWLVSERTLSTQNSVPLLLFHCVLMHARTVFSGFSQLQLFLSPTFFVHQSSVQFGVMLLVLKKIA